MVSISTWQSKKLLFCTFWVSPPRNLANHNHYPAHRCQHHCWNTRRKMKEVSQTCQSP